MGIAPHDHGIAPGNRRALIGNSEALVAREHLSRSALGSAVPGDASVSGRLGRGSDMRPGTADRVTACLNPEPVGPRFLQEAEAVHAASEDGAMAVPVDAAGHKEREMNEIARYMTTAHAAAHLGLSPRTLESYRCRGGGPPFYVFGSVVRYLLSDVVRWASERRRNSTSDDGLRSAAPKRGDEENDGEGEDDGADGPGEARR